MVGGNVTDYDGNYLVKPLEPGYYTVLVRYTGYDSVKVTSVIVAPDERTKQNFQMHKPRGRELHQVIVMGYKKTLVNREEPNRIITGGEIRVMGGGEISDLTPTSPNIYQQQRGKDVQPNGRIIKPRIAIPPEKKNAQHAKQPDLEPGRTTWTQDEIKQMPL
jgi:hypothetical protein